MSTAIQKAEPTILDLLVTSEWPRALIEVVKRQSCPKDIPNDEFYVFVKKCQQTGLNPLIGEALCVPRNDKHKGKVYTFQPTAEGMQARAARFPDFRKVDSGYVCEKDTEDYINQGTGEIRHSFSASKPRGMLKGAWGRVVKRDGTAVVAWLPVGSRSGDSQFWTSDPGNQLAKCARVAALRLAYPVAFEGVYIAEEMPTEAAPGRMERVMGDAPKEEPALPPVAPKPTVAFGPRKGTEISTLTREQADEVLALGGIQCAEQPKAKWVKAVRENMEAIRAHRDSLVKALPSDTTEAVLVSSEPTEAEMAEIRAREEAST